MAQLIGRNLEGTDPIHLSCDSIADLPEEECQAIKKMAHITRIEKNEIEFVTIGEMTDAGVLASLKAPKKPLSA